MQVRNFGSEAADASTAITASAASPHGSHVQGTHDMHDMCDLDSISMQIRNSQIDNHISRQVHELLTDIDAAAVSSDQCNDIGHSTVLAGVMAACTTAGPQTATARPQLASVRAPPATAQPHPAVARDPHITAKTAAGTLKAAYNFTTLDSNEPYTAGNNAAFKVAEKGSHGGICSKAGAALAPSAMDMDDHFCRWRTIARQNQSLGNVAYLPLPYWAARLAPYPGCQIKSDQTRFWVQF